MPEPSTAGVNEGMTQTVRPAELNPARVLVCGDWHGNLRHMKTAIAAADRHGCQAIVGCLAFCPDLRRCKKIRDGFPA